MTSLQFYMKTAWSEQVLHSYQYKYRNSFLFLFLFVLLLPVLVVLSAGMKMSFFNDVLVKPCSTIAQVLLHAEIFLFDAPANLRIAQVPVLYHNHGNVVQVLLLVAHKCRFSMLYCINSTKCC